MNKLYVYAAAIAITFGAGWTANGWRMGSKLDAFKAQQSEAVAAANASALALQKTLDNERDGKAKELAAIDGKYTGQLKEANDETNRLQRCIDNGTCGLRINTIRTACPSAVPGTSAAASVDSGAGTELAPAARQDYFSLRSGLNRQRAKLAACQESLSVNTRPAQR